MGKLFILLPGYFLLVGGGLLAQTVIRMRSQGHTYSDYPSPNMDATPQKDEVRSPYKPEPDPDVNAFVVVEREPVPINLDEIRRRIVYPPLAEEAGIQGKVIVRVLVGKDGKYRKHVILKSPHKILTEAVEKELPNLEFTPGMLAGKPVKVWVTIPFDICLQGRPRLR